MKKFLACLALVALTGCQTLPEPSPYDGKCYSDPMGVVQVKIYGRADFEGGNGLEPGPGYKFAFINRMFGQYGEGVAPAATVEEDLKGGLQEIACTEEWDQMHTEFQEWKAQQEKEKSE